ncbi:MAG TPA: hypothetical protein VGS22_04395 [Thermoanaerobaculia bacterium]|jgi:hypothetical protein|nr:hypothetical protein [Thermoanaerobaculia bacterium]
MPTSRTLGAFCIAGSILLFPLAGFAAKPKPAPKPSAAPKGPHFRLDKITSTFSYTCGFRVASPDERGTARRMVVLSSVPIDCAAADQEFDPVAAVEAAIETQKGAHVTLTLQADGVRADGSWRSIEPSDGFSFGGQGKLTFTRNDDQRVEGRYYTEKPDSFFDKTYEFDLPFAVDLLAGSLSGTPLPKGGGEPGKVYQAYMKAMAKKDSTALQKVVTKAKAEEIAEQVKAEIWDELSKMTRGLEFQTATITGGLLKNTRAALDIEGKSFDGDKFRGRIFLIQEDGAWKVSGRDTRIVLD